MNLKKRIILILSLIILTMLIIPLITVNTVKGGAGMFICLLLFFAVYPVVSVVVGIISAKAVKYLWFTPFLTALSFRAFAFCTYKTAFPFIYSAFYFIICSLSILVNWLITRKKGE